MGWWLGLSAFQTLYFSFLLSYIRKQKLLRILKGVLKEFWKSFCQFSQPFQPKRSTSLKSAEPDLNGLAIKILYEHLKKYLLKISKAVSQGCLSSPNTLIIVTWARLRQAAGKLDAVNRVRFLYICRALGHQSQPTTWQMRLTRARAMLIYIIAGTIKT